MSSVELSLLPHQYEFVNNTNHRFVGLVGGYGCGKALEVNQIVYTPFGTKRIGDCVVGDVIIGQDGQPTTITAVYPQGIRQLFKVTFIDGQSVIADGDHLWSAWQTTPTRKGYIRNRVVYKDGKPFYEIDKRKLFTTNQLLSAMQDGIRYAIPLNKPVEFNQSDCPIDRYVIGALIGDGCLTQKYCIFLSNKDEEVLAYVNEHYPLTHTTNYDYRLQNNATLKFELRRMGLMGKYSHNKFIPSELLYDSIDNRWALLQGLMDTDGTVDKRGNCTFTTTSYQLAQDVVWLCRSLGLRSKIQYTRKTTHKDAYDVKLVGDLSNVFRLTRKKERIGNHNSDGLVIKSIEQVEDGEAVCIAIDNTNKLFLTNDFIVTHNTFSFVSKGIFLAFLNPGCDGALLEPTNAMAANVLEPELEEALIRLGIPYDYRATPYPTYYLHFEIPPENEYEEPIIKTSTIRILSAENYKRHVGLNLAWFGVDEADTIKKEIAWKMWRMLISRLRDKQAKVVQGFTTSTPEGYNFLYEFFVKEPAERLREGRPVQDRCFYKASTYDNIDNLEPGYIDSLLEQYPSNLIEGYLNGEFTNLQTGNVYDNFNRNQNNTTRTLQDFDEYNQHGELQHLAPIHIGIDFNVNKCCGIVHVIEEKVDEQHYHPDIHDQRGIQYNKKTTRVYAVDEITGEKNTESLIKEILKRYSGRKITVYPDSSGKNEKSNSSATDIKLLKKHFTCRYNSKNPPVQDRINSMNAMFRNGEGEVRYYVNVQQLPVYVEALETQGWDDNGKPDKAHDQDHPPDAAGYFIFKMFPVRAHHRKVKLKGY